MRLNGWQKVTLLDYPGKVACTVFTGGCNMRCPFCHNASLVVRQPKDTIDEEEFFAYLERCQGKLDAVCITGGEPLLQKDIQDFIRKIKNLGFLVKLDTNGWLTKQLQELVQLKLVDYVAMDIKNTPEKYSVTTGVNVDVEAIKESVSFLQKAGIPHEFRTTVVDEFHTVEDIQQIVQWVFPSSYYLQCFQDSGDLIGENLHAPKKEVLHQMYEKGKEISSCVFLRGIE